MDGLDSRGKITLNHFYVALNFTLGQVIVIGATNRIDAIDPALRRPGRFDREFYFPLPAEDARRKIIQICTNEWDPSPDKKLIDDLAKGTRGYCGADVKVCILYTYTKRPCGEKSNF